MIPTSLTSRRQWVTWRYEEDPNRPDKPKKMPKNPATGNNAQSNNAQTWGTHQQTTKAAEGRKHDGVGFVFSPDDPFVGGDFDGCRNKETGEIASWAAVWIERLKPVAYIEVSPSKLGIKFITCGTLPKALKKSLGDHVGVELYDRRRFFTITGDRVDGCADEPGDGQAILDDLLAHFDPPAAAPAGAGSPTQQEQPHVASSDWRSVRAAAVASITRQWVEGRIAHAQEQLAAALNGTRHNRRIEMGRLLGGAVASAPAYLSAEDAERILFDAQPPAAHAATERKAIQDGIADGLKSPLPLPAFPTDHDLQFDGGTPHCPACGTQVRRSKESIPYPGSNQSGWYCPRCRFPMVWPYEAHTGPAGTDAERPISQDEATVSGTPLLIRATDLGQLPPAVALIPELLYSNRLHVLFGAPGSGKSFIALDLACTIAQYAPVVYLAAEAIEDYEARVEAWQAHHKRPVDRLYFWREPVRLAFTNEVAQFTQAAAAVGPAAIFVDPLADCMAGLVESTSEGMSVAVQGLNAIRRGTGAGLGVVHHTGWDDQRERGSSLLRGAARVVVKIEQRDDGLIGVSCVKKNQGKPFAPRSFRLIPSGELGAVVPVPSSRVLRTRGDKPSERMLKVLEELTTEPLRNGATHKQIMDGTGYPAATINRLLTDLTDNRYVISQERGRSTVYIISDLGHAAMEEAHNWGDHDTALGRGSSTPSKVLPPDTLNWPVLLPNSFQHQDAVLPTSSTRLPPKSVRSSTLLSASIEAESGRTLEELSDGTPTAEIEEAEIDADVARVEARRRGYQAPEGY